MLTKAKVALQVTELLDRLPRDERGWVLRRCRDYVHQERLHLSQTVGEMEDAGELTEAVREAFKLRATTLRTLDRVLDLLGHLV